MADAIEETTNPDKHCNTDVTVHDSSLHSEQGVHSENNPIETTETDIINESTTDTIPCEHCNAQISLNDWEIHTKQCADAHKPRVENLKANIEAESMTTLIPCEYCDALINAHDWEWHSRQCADTYRRNPTNRENDKNETMIELIPCEYCDALISVDDWTSHMDQCGEAEKQRIENITNRAANNLIPCEYCGVQVSLKDWTSHTNHCDEAEKQRVENITNRATDNLIPCEYCSKCFALQNFEEHRAECHRKQTALLYESNNFQGQVFGGNFPFPEKWDQSSPYNLSRYILRPNSTEFKFVADNFHKSLPSNEIVQIERIQNRRWYRQYDAHKDEFIERYGKSTEQWLFHGCKSQSIEPIISDCFNRSHVVRHAVGQGIYFAADAGTSLNYTEPDSNNVRHMFMARVLVGKTTAGHPLTRVCPPGYDTTGGGTVFVTYHDAQAYGEYLIAFK